MAGIAVNDLGPAGNPASAAFRGEAGWGFACQMIREAFTALGLPGPGLSQVRP